MHHKTPVVVAGLLFALIALVQLWALATNAAMTVNGNVVPAWPHVVALIVAGLMSIWLFSWCCCCKRSCCGCCGKDKDHCCCNKNPSNNGKYNRQ